MGSIDCCTIRTPATAHDRILIFLSVQRGGAAGGRQPMFFTILYTLLTGVLFPYQRLQITEEAKAASTALSSVAVIGSANDQRELK